MKLTQFLILLAFVVISCKKEDVSPKEDVNSDTTNTQNYLPIEIKSDLTHVSEYGSKDGAIKLTITGGKSPYRFEWSNLKTTQNINNLYAGKYWVKVYDQRDIMATDTFEIEQPSSTELLLSHQVTITSDEFSTDGSITISVSGGLPPYSFLWNTDAKSNTINNLGVGTYYVTVTDHSEQLKIDSITLPIPTITDFDGNVYNIIKIGTQTWMQENLKVTHTDDGTPIENFDYNNNPEYTPDYGKLYTWTAMMNGSTEEKAQGICPDGWHIPSDQEWMELEKYLGMSASDAELNNTWRGTGIGTSMKIGGDSGLDFPMAGRMNGPSNFSLLNQYGYIWTSTESGNNAFRRCLSSSANNVGRWDSFPKYYGFSVRCIKND